MTIRGLLGAIAARGRIVLPAGLAVGVLLPQFAILVQPYVGVFVVLLLFLAGLRIGPRAALGALSDIRTSAVLAIIYQLAFPLIFIAAISLTGWHGIAVSFLVLMMAASPISGTPNLTIIMGHDPAPALRLLIFGTAILPATAFVVLWAAPGFGDTGTLLASSLTLLFYILLACAVAFAIRHFWLRDLSSQNLASIDGLSALAMAMVVIGLMSTVGGTLLSQPIEVLKVLAIVFAASFGLQIVSSLVLARTGVKNTDIPGLGVCSGNRNCALFLASMPFGIIEPLLLYIGCYQIPMYVTPILLSRFYEKFPNRSAISG